MHEPSSIPSTEETAAHLAAVVESSDDAIVSKTLDSIIKTWNPAAERMFGYTAAEVVGRSITLIIPTERLSEEDFVLSKIRRGESVHHFETERLRKDGRRVFISLTVSPIRNVDGVVIGASKIARDISDRRRRDARLTFLANATERLAASLDHAATLEAVAQLAVPAFADWATVDVVEDGALQRVATAHIDPEKIALAEEIKRRYPPDPNARVGVPAILRSGKPEFVREIPEATFTALSRDEDERAMVAKLGLHSYIGVPLRLRGRTMGVLTFVTAESRRRYDEGDLALAQSLADRAAVALENARLYREAERLRTEAEDASRAKDEFLAILGHELRNPLAPIVTAMAVMKLKGGDAFAKERAMIDRQLQHVTRLVDDLLDISRITRGKVELANEPLDVSALVTQALETVSPLLERRKHTVTREVSSGLVVLGDRTRLAQVLDNLLTNAAKYTPEGGHIEVTAKRVDEAVVVTVRDNGRGIAKTLLPYVFDLFVQGRQSIDRGQGGLGIGLAIVKRLAELHGGAVTAESDGEGRGSTFVLRLPASEAVGSRPPSMIVEMPKGATAKAATVLLVDDNVDAAELLRMALEAEGYRVVVAADGPSALVVARAERPTVALLDIGLPVMDGYELAVQLRALEGFAGVGLVAVTGYGQERDRERSTAAGFDAHLTKPVPIERLMEVVRTFGRG